MYLAVVLLTMLVLPLGSMLAEHGVQSGDWLMLAGKWFVFWGVGVRLALAGARQFLQPGFTAKAIFNLDEPAVLPIIRELGVANFATGIVGLMSLVRPDFRLAAALAAAIFYSVAGVRHTLAGHRTANENIAMVSDLFIAVVLIAYLSQALIP